MGIVVINAQIASDGRWQLNPESNHCGAAFEYCLAAPGTNILSTIEGNDYALATGTSMAAPHIAGAAAVVMAAFPDVTEREIVNRLLHAGSKADKGPDRDTGWGLFSLDRAISPMGQLNVAQGTAIGMNEGLSLGQAALPSALGNALGGSVLAKSVLALDELNFPFTVDLTKNPGISRAEQSLFSAKSQNATDREMHPAHNRLTFQTGAGEGTLYLDAQAYDISGFISGQNSFASQMAPQMTTLVAQQTSGLSLSLPVGPQNTGWQVHAAHGQAISYDNPLSFQTSTSDQTGTSSTALTQAGLSKAFGPALQIGFEAGQVREKGRLLGEAIGVSYQGNRAHETIYGQVAATARLSPTMSLSGYYATGKTELAVSNFVTTSDNLPIRTAGMAFSVIDIVKKGSRFSVNLSQPLALDGGSITLSLPVQRTKKGKILYAQEEVNLKNDKALLMQSSLSLPLNNTMWMALDGYIENQNDELASAILLSFGGRFRR